MKFVVTKGGVECFACKGEIVKGEDMAQIFTKTQNIGYIPRNFHTACYIPYVTDKFNEKWFAWKNNAIMPNRPKNGRPVTYSEPTKAQMMNRLRSNLSYHLKQGNMLKVQTMQAEIIKLGGKTNIE
jgi:hypothetical protein